MPSSSSIFSECDRRWIHRPYHHLGTQHYRLCRNDFASWVKVVRAGNISVGKVYDGVTWARSEATQPSAWRKPYTWTCGRERKYNDLINGYVGHVSVTVGTLHT